jgi:hypothetical protein
MEPVIIRGGEPAELASLSVAGGWDGLRYWYGYGSWFGDGSGCGFGFGYDDGSGEGAGYGYGDGSGFGYGYGYGSGTGSGSGSKEYWQATILNFAAKWPPEQLVRFAAASFAGATIAFWRSCEKGLPVNGGGGQIEPAAPGIIHTAPGPLSLCAQGTLHATLIPPKWRGLRWWIVALHGDVIGDEETYGCLKREILGEAL